jgi:hypothetical protein
MTFSTVAPWGKHQHSVVQFLDFAAPFGSQMIIRLEIVLPILLEIPAHPEGSVNAPQ